MTGAGEEMFDGLRNRLPEGRCGEAEVSYITVTADMSARSAARGNYVPPGDYVRLRVGPTYVMSDTPMERRSNLEVVRRAHGRVLIAGLGLGMILGPILRKSEVESVTVVEVSRDVVNLIAPRWADPKLTVIGGDIWEYSPRLGELNTVYFDIWPLRSRDNLPQMAELRRRALCWLDPKDPSGWVGSWYETELQGG